MWARSEILGRNATHQCLHLLKDKDGTRDSTPSQYTHFYSLYPVAGIPRYEHSWATYQQHRTHNSRYFSLWQNILKTSCWGKKVEARYSLRQPLNILSPVQHKTATRDAFYCTNRPKEIFTAAKYCDLPPLHKDWKENKNPKEFHSCE